VASGDAAGLDQTALWEAGLVCEVSESEASEPDEELPPPMRPTLIYDGG